MDDAPTELAAMRTDPRPFGPPAGSRKALWIVGTLAVIALAAGGVYWWQQRSAAPAPPPALPAAAPVAVAAPSSAAAPEPVIQHPIDAPSAAAVRSGSSAVDADAAVKLALIDLLGAKPVAAVLQTDNFVRRVVATVDNLGRAHAAPLLWPVVPTSGKFTVQRNGDAEQIAPTNTARYDAFVAFVSSVDAPRAAAFYKSNYPLFQSAYRELGYPRGYFNDRLVEVIDQLLAAPEPVAPVAVRLTDVKGPIASDRPWVRYEFADPALEALPAGSKMLVRMGPEHARRLKAKLQAFRAVVASAPAKN